MSFLRDSIDAALPDPAAGVSGTYSGRIASNPGDLADKVMVTLDAFTDAGAAFQFGPCRWQSRDATSLPARGDRCLVLFDDDTGEPWVPLWWPFDT